METNGAVGRDIAGFLRHEYDHIGHHHQVGVESAKLVQNLGVGVVGRLHKGQPFFQGKFLDRIDGFAFFIRRTVDGNHVVAALQHRLQASLTEGLLSVHDNPHICFLSHYGR